MSEIILKNGTKIISKSKKKVRGIGKEILVVS